MSTVPTSAWLRSPGDQEALETQDRSAGAGLPLWAALACSRWEPGHWDLSCALFSIQSHPAALPVAGPTAATGSCCPVTWGQGHVPSLATLRSPQTGRSMGQVRRPHSPEAAGVGLAHHTVVGRGQGVEPEVGCTLGAGLRRGRALEPIVAGKGENSVWGRRVGLGKGPRAPQCPHREGSDNPR